MDRTPLVKLLLISALSAGLVVPLFFYSRGMLKQAEQALAAAQTPAELLNETETATTPQYHGLGHRIATQKACFTQ